MLLDVKLQCLQKVSIDDPAGRNSLQMSVFFPLPHFNLVFVCNPNITSMWNIITAAKIWLSQCMNESAHLHKRREIRAIDQNMDN